MPRNIVLCFDGTSCQFGAENTNVVRLVQCLDRDPDRQRLYYDPGVGTLPGPGSWQKISERMSLVWAQAVGGGLIENIQEAYTYLMETWKYGDQVYMFGFSRGAYTARALAGMLHTLGLLPDGGHNLVPYALRLFNSVRGTHVTKNPKKSIWELCDEFRWTFARETPNDRDENGNPLDRGKLEARRFPIRFLGMWDTVASVGWWNPVKFPHTRKNVSVQTARQALALDERRAFFRPNLLVEQEGLDVKQVWFAGSHSDVGGGMPVEHGGLWRAPFEWMVDEARNAGLQFDAQRIENLLADVNREPWLEPHEVSLVGAWWINEFLPKKMWNTAKNHDTWQLGLGRRRRVAANSLIHHSVVRRIREKRGYRPENLSSEFITAVRGPSDSLHPENDIYWRQDTAHARPVPAPHMAIRPVRKRAAS